MTQRIALALSGGNALGAYAAGACEALQDAGLWPHLVSGASIGAVVATLLAGNPPERRVPQLRRFWEAAAQHSLLPPATTGPARDAVNKWHAAQAFFWGRPALFTPRPSGFLSLLPGTPPDIGLFDGRPLLNTLAELVDYELVNRGDLPLLIGCVDLETGEAVTFDSRRQRIEPEHVLASTAFIPGFPPVEVGGRLLGDPGMLCNLPLDPLLAEHERDQLLVAVDLFDARGERPHSMDTALERTQDIAFASQSLRTLEAFRREQRLRHRLAERGDQDTVAATTEVVLVAYRPPRHELGGKALEFSAASVQQRWVAGRDDLAAALKARAEGRVALREPGYVLVDGRWPHAREHGRPEPVSGAGDLRPTATAGGTN
ncbi:patatin-like phospholipase family protein [Aquabacterium sp. J223]|uniref:patatin-like phospholipase family protein n=1 Tax=Aquabacterium sp. J223 TaxID=2898431 RepID=UPI0021ADC2FA|nr:patatin-like phospholipase family protein [Aquabacterium sp. J223]UUX94926.1 patatin-like phospholipase family protein [Aquabacterium sp. J223]